MVVLFTHVPKTAGTTINDAVFRAIGERGFVQVANQSEVAALLKTGIGLGTRFVCGHINYWDAHRLAPSGKAIAGLRNPVDRILSHYLMRIRDPDDPIVDQDMLAHPFGPAFWSFYGKYIIGQRKDNLCSRYLCGVADFRTALETLSQRYMLVWSSPSDAWPHIWNMLGLSGDPDPLVRGNPAPSGVPPERGGAVTNYRTLLSADDLGRLEELEAHDLALYQWLQSRGGLFVSGRS